MGAPQGGGGGASMHVIVVGEGGGRETLMSPIPCPVFCFTGVWGRANPKSKSKSESLHSFPKAQALPPSQRNMILRGYS